MNDREIIQTNILTEMLKDGFISSHAVAIRFGITERHARRLLSKIAKTHPLIATSDRNGYRIAVGQSDIDDARHAYNENCKRAAEILKRNEPLQEFLTQCETVR